MKTTIFLLFGLVAIVGCKNRETSVQSKLNESDTAVYSFKSHVKTLGDCSDENLPCARINLTWIELDVEQSESFQKIDRVLRENLLLGEDGKVLEDVFALQDAFFLEYEQITKEMPDYLTEWVLEHTYDVNYNQNGILGVTHLLYQYTGGAHGNSYVEYLNFDIQSGDRLKLENVVEKGKHADFLLMAENAFRKSQNVGENTEWADAGFWFEEGFYLPDNFRFQSDGLSFLYNSYEIAPYAAGQIELVLGWDALKPFIFERFSGDSSSGEALTALN